MKPLKPLTHALWVQEWDGAKFLRWRNAGEGYLAVDEKGRTAAHNFHAMLPVGGWSGYSVLLPIGEPPPDPPKQKEQITTANDEDAAS